MPSGGRGRTTQRGTHVTATNAWLRRTASGKRGSKGKGASRHVRLPRHRRPPTNCRVAAGAQPHSDCSDWPVWRTPTGWRMGCRLSAPTMALPLPCYTSSPRPPGFEWPSFAASLCRRLLPLYHLRTCFSSIPNFLASPCRLCLGVLLVPSGAPEA
jgi:hypothetical protein